MFLPEDGEAGSCAVPTSCTGAGCLTVAGAGSCGDGYVCCLSSCDMIKGGECKNSSQCTNSGKMQYKGDGCPNHVIGVCRDKGFTYTCCACLEATAPEGTTDLCNYFATHGVYPFGQYKGCCSLSDPDQSGTNLWIPYTPGTPCTALCNAGETCYVIHNANAVCPN